MSNVVDMDRYRPPPNPGNGAREALIELALTFPNTSEHDAGLWTDMLLTELWMRGFKVVRLEPTEDSA
jgi:hypothetical protein